MWCWKLNLGLTLTRFSLEPSPLLVLSLLFKKWVGNPPFLSCTLISIVKNC